ncbi:hypothetical protein EGI16_03620 [Chryseobacterium sp. G0240]|uniref:hypothetical protein n=1 Tax=Chryseobacterium sp. G0240 TaxID=2487066 RepID=UPI000F44BC30|nr:hypothetical protein [Chryseobacterium sp. G0240]ROI05487.1 hypothetical protein EGI16_03620 [Chryseobacterium sp. G0240]
MLTNVASKSDIKKELEKYQFHAEIHLSENPEEVILWANEALVYLGRTAKLIADAQYHRDRKMRSELTEQLKLITSFAPSTANKFVDSLMEEESYLLKWAERLNAAFARQIDFARTIISKAKEELKYTNNG